MARGIANYFINEREDIFGWKMMVKRRLLPPDRVVLFRFAAIHDFSQRFEDSDVCHISYSRERERERERERIYSRTLVVSNILVRAKTGALELQTMRRK